MCFSRCKSGLAAECEMLEGSFGCFLAVEDGDAVIHLRSPEMVMCRAMADDMLAGDVVSVVVQRGVEGVFGSDLVDIPRRHVGAGENFFFRSDLAVASQILTNSSLMRDGCIFTCVGLGARHTLNPTSYLVKVTIFDASDWFVIFLN